MFTVNVLALVVAAVACHSVCSRCIRQIRRTAGTHGSDLDLHAYSIKKNRWTVFKTDGVVAGVLGYGPKPGPQEIAYFEHSRNHW
jgi:hypothetical protein